MAAGEEKLRLVLAAIDKTAAPIRAVNRRIESMLAPVRKVRNAMRSLAEEAGLPRLGRGLAKLGGLIRNLAVGAVGAGVGLLEFARRTAESADELGEFTALIGFGVEEFQEYQFAAKRAGVENEAFAAAMRTLSRNVGAAQAGTGRLAGLLKKVAPSVLKQVKGARDTGEALEIVLAAMRRLPDAMKRNVLASSAFGNAQLALLASLSPEEFQRLREEARALGVVFSAETAADAGSLMDGIDDLKASVLGLARSIVSALFPDLKAATGVMIEWLKANRELVVSGGKEAILAFASGMKELGVFLVENVPKLRQFIADVGGLRTVLVAIAAVSLAPLLQAVVAIGIALGGPVSAALALGAALVYVLSRIDQVKAGMATIAGAFGFDVGPSRLPFTPAAPGAASAVQAQAAAASARLDGALAVDINLDDRRARVARATSSNPMVQFGNLSRGVALGAQ